MNGLTEALAAIAVAVGLGGADHPTAHGYVEAESLRLAAPSAGILEALAVTRGGTVAPGGALFTIDRTTAIAERDRLAAMLAQAKAERADLSTGRRPDEIAAIEAQRAQAEAVLHHTRADFDRQQTLAARAVASADKLDAARADFQQATGRVAELQASLAVARLPARPEQIAAADAAITAARSALAEQDRHLDELAPTAPATALVEDTYFNPGEWVPAGATVVSLLPPERRKLVVFVPETRLASLRPGKVLPVSCDGCSSGMTATITYLSPRAEYTPPVIYSVGSREKLMFRVELKPTPPVDLPVGLPVDVDLPQ